METAFPCVECDEAFDTSIERILHRYLSHPHYTTTGGGRCRICGQHVLDLFENIDHLMTEHSDEFVYFSAEAQQLNARIGVSQSVVYWLQATCQPLAEQPLPFFTPQDIIIRMRLRADSLALENNGRREELLVEDTFEYFPPLSTSRETLEGMIGLGINDSTGTINYLPCNPSTSAATPTLLGKRKNDDPPSNCAPPPKTEKAENQLRESPPSDCLDASDASSSALLQPPKHSTQMKDLNNGRVALILSMLINFGSPLEERTSGRVMAEAERIAVQIFLMPHRLPDYDARVMRAVRRTAAAVQKAVSREEPFTLTEPLPHEIEMKAIQLATLLQPFYPDASPSPSDIHSIDKLSRALELLLATGDVELTHHLDELLEVLQQHLQQCGVRDHVQQALHAIHMHDQVMELRSTTSHPAESWDKPDDGFAPGPSSMAVEHSKGRPIHDDEKGTIKDEREKKLQQDKSHSKEVSSGAVKQRTTLATFLGHSLSEAKGIIKEEQPSQRSCNTTASSAAIDDPAASPVLFEDVKEEIKTEPHVSASGRADSPFFITPSSDDLPASPNNNDGRMVPAPFVSYSAAVKLYEEDKELWRGYPEPRSCKHGCVANFSQTALVRHYRMFHYDIYFLAVYRSWESEQRRWLAVRFGDETIRKNKKENTRVCLLCGASQFFNDRMHLARHLKEEHPEFLTDLRTEFLELFDGEIKPDPIVRVLLEHVD